MYQYSAIQWLFCFYTYCFLGWVWESCYVSAKEKKWVNRGFMRGPFLPIYGSGATFMLFAAMPFGGKVIPTYFAGVVLCTLMELVTGIIMKNLFQVRYWDYSKHFMNYHGYICLRSSLCWGFFTILMTQFLQYQTEKVMFAIPSLALTIGTYVLTALLCMDFALSFKAALDIRFLLSKMVRAKQELANMQKRLDVIIALTNQDLQEKKDNISETAVGTRYTEMKSSVEDRLSQLKEMIYTSKTSDKMREFRDEIMEIWTRYAKNDPVVVEENFLEDAFKRDIFLGNPGMISDDYSEELEFLKEKYNGPKVQTSDKEEKYVKDKPSKRNVCKKKKK